MSNVDNYNYTKSSLSNNILNETYDFNRQLANNYHQNLN